MNDHDQYHKTIFTVILKLSFDQINILKEKSKKEKKKIIDQLHQIWDCSNTNMALYAKNVNCLLIKPPS